MAFVDDTMPAKRPVTLRDLLTFTLGTGIVVAEPGTIPIADALNALHSDELEQRTHLIGLGMASAIVLAAGEVVKSICRNRTSCSMYGRR